MKLNRIEVAGIFASLMLAILAGVFFVSQTAHADVDPCALPGMVMLGCDDGSGNGGVEEGNQDNDDSLAEEINCEIFAQLTAQGSPIPSGFDGSGCGDDDDDDNGGGGDGGGGGGEGGGDNGGEGNACSDTIDNDNDGKVDLLDPGCTGADDDDETDGSGGNSGGSTDSSGGGGGGGGSGCGNNCYPDATTTASTGGSVSGAATSTPAIACDAYLTAFIKFGGKNDADQVKRLQHVLKNFEGASVEENGTYDAATHSAVHAFQTKYWDTILAPWDIKESTGYVYLTTRKKVNEIYCKNNVAFPLSANENKLIESTKVTPTHPTTPHVSTPAAASASTGGKAAPVPTKTTTKSATSTKATSTQESSRGGILDFFRRLFKRGE